MLNGRVRGHTSSVTTHNRVGSGQLAECLQQCRNWNSSYIGTVPKTEPLMVLIDPLKLRRLNSGDSRNLLVKLRN